MRQRRLELGLSVRAAAHMAELNRATWSSAERGARALRQHNQANIERALGWTPGQAARILSGAPEAAATRAGRPTSGASTVSRPGTGPSPSGAGTPAFDLRVEIERVSRFNLPADVRLQLIHRILDVYDQATVQATAQAQYRPRRGS
ncbi:MAG: helix-turn-helix transcriptional regulator [Micromonosporaceae bacterium]|nr:helix-turn-helix transcriptional regulator [Micromonosporaceae bacterium]